MTLLDELKAILATDLPHQDDPRKLAKILYDRCYMASIVDPPANTTHGDSDDLTPLLAAANKSRSVWDEGWKVDQLLEGGRILARKGRAARAFLPGEYLTHRGVGSGPAAGAMVSIFVSAASTELQPEYYYAFSEAVSEFEESESVVRFFWNISAEGAPRLVEAVTREFNRFQIPFRFKCAKRPSDYPRRDAGVVYVHSRYFPITALVVESVHGMVRPWLYPDTPLFTKRLADGLALAEDPGESFGENRMRTLATAIAASRGRPMSERLAQVQLEFEKQGLSFERPWLNAGSTDRYDFPFPTS